MGKSQFNSVTRMWWGHVHLRIGGNCQIRPNKGFKPTQFTHLGEVLEFARSVNTSAYIHAIEKGKVIPSKEDQMKLEKLLGVPLSKASKKPRPRRSEGGVTSATRFQSSVKFACAFSTARATPLKVHYPSKVIVGTLAATPRTQGEQRAKKIDAFNLRKVTISERMHKLGVKEADIIELFIKGGGAGGQKINKTNNCVLLKHIPSEIIIRCQKERSREQNRRIARRLLVEKLEKITLDKQRKEIEEFQKNLRRTRQPTESQKLRMRREKERRSQIKRQRASASSIIDF
ncbi:hypothetical protein IE077_000819 [Cardiosporidium cionae]|uniref:HTH cro/C1-type domain-containing protein n=1 Tax=Cardiosporidium cionae TaxID=476202 RepID=A0ABQ7JE03_9APIC|nr:hypothetical protein IE077_000819 [Cardiosporidium cionae]|eukprot:KAF8822206.1 hypothetical protein IE077_000819 [Cardiosporidium cionae]